MKSSFKGTDEETWEGKKLDKLWQVQEMRKAWEL